MLFSHLGNVSHCSPRFCLGKLYPKPYLDSQNRNTVRLPLLRLLRLES